MCPRRFISGEKYGFLDYGLFRKIIDELSLHRGVALVPFFRGEPLLHPRFAQMLKYVKAKGVAPVQLATNATLLTKKVSSLILDLGVEFISFSLDAVDEAVYGAIRRGAGFAGVMKNIEAFLELKQKRRLPLPDVQVSMVKTPENRAQIKRFISFWSDKVDRVRIYEEHSGLGYYGGLKNGRGGPGKRYPCLKLLTDMAVYWDGDVGLCCQYWRHNGFIGNVKTHSISRVWNNSRYRWLRTMHFHNRAHFDNVCANCDYWKADYLPAGIIGRLYVSSKCAE
jgi:radical SAM protein with 4Fe4S-binding SPASM domain